MPRLKPLPEGPLAEARAVSGGEEKAAALAGWTRVLSTAVQDPEAAVQGIAGELSRALRDLLRTWNVYRDKPERLELAVALSFLREAKAGEEGRAPESLRDYLWEGERKPVTDADRERATLAKQEIERRQQQNVVPNLIGKLAGRAPMSLRDAQWLIAAVVLNWPSPSGESGASKDLRMQALTARRFALAFLKAFVLTKTAGMSEEVKRELEQDFCETDEEPGKGKDLDRWIFPLVRDGDSRDVFALLDDAAKGPGALIIASSDKIFIEDDSVVSIQHFAELAERFSRPDESGLLIFILDAGFLRPKARIGRRRSLFNIHVLLSALTSFAMLGKDSAVDPDGESIKKNLKRWQRFKDRCCIILHDFCLVQSNDFSIAKGHKIDEAVREICRLEKFEFPDVPPPQLGASTDNYHVLPYAFPDWVDSRRALTPKNLTANEFHLWNVLVDDAQNENEPNITYFIVPKQTVPDPGELLMGHKEGDVGARRYISGGMAYLTECQKAPKVHVRDAFDRAQRIVYWAARGRLLKDSASTDEHRRDMRAVAELREIGFEVMPVEVALAMLSYFPSEQLSSATYRRSTGHQ